MYCVCVCFNCRQSDHALHLQAGKTVTALCHVKPQSLSSRRQITLAQVGSELPAPPCTPVFSEYIQVEPVLYSLARKELRSEMLSALWVSFCLYTLSAAHFVSHLLATQSRCNLAKISD